MKVSHFFLSLFLIAVGCTFGYFYIIAWIESGSILLLLYIPIILLVVVLPLYAGFGLIVEDIKNAHNKEE